MTGQRTDADWLRGARTQQAEVREALMRRLFGDPEPTGDLVEIPKPEPDQGPEAA